MISKACFVVGSLLVFIAAARVGGVETMVAAVLFIIGTLWPSPK